MSLILALACFARSQDLEKTIDDLLQRMASDSLVEREEAHEAIAKLGMEALAVLEKKLPRADGDLCERIEKAIAILRGDDRRAHVLPPLKRVTVKATAKPIAAVLADIRSQTGLPLQFDPKDPTLVTVAIENATPLQALDEVSRQAKKIRYAFAGDASDQPGIKGESTTEEFVDYPAAYVRHYKIAVTSVGTYKSNNFKTDLAQTQLGLQIDWAPDVRPNALRRIRLEEVVDDRGTSLYDPKLDDDDRSSDASDSYVQTSFTLAHPADGVRKMARIQGTVVVRYAQGVKKLVFANPEKAAGTTQEFQGLKITLVSFTEREGGAVVKLAYEGRNRGVVDPYAKARDEDGDWPFETDDVRVALDGGAFADSSGAGGSRSGDKGDWEIEYDYAGAKPKAVEVSLVIGYFYDEFEFEIRDVPFPK